MAGFCITAMFVIATIFTVFLLFHTGVTWTGGLNVPQKWLAGRECKSLPTPPKDRRRNKSRLRIVTMNAEWLYLYGGSGGLLCPGPRCTWKTPVQAKEHLDRVKGVISRLDGDIVNIVEVEDCRVMSELAVGGHNNTRLGGRYKSYLTKSTDNALGQNVGLLTRIDPISFSRSPLTRRLRPSAATNLL